MNEASIRMDKKVFSSVRPQRISHLIETQIRVAAEAVRRANDDDIKKLEATNKRHAGELMSGGAASEHDQSVHSLIAEISGNRVFALRMKVLTDIHAVRMKNIRLDDKGKRALIRQHEQIIEGIKKKDPEMAHEKMRRHIMDIQKELSRLEKAGLE